MREQRLSAAERQQAIRRVERLSRLLDTSLRLPGTRFRFGLDPLIGLIPGLGDAAALSLSAYIIWQGWRLGAPRRTLVRMGANLALDSVVGAIPIVGDLFDFAFKANRRNVRLLRRMPLAGPARPSPVPESRASRLAAQPR